MNTIEPLKVEDVLEQIDAMHRDGTRDMDARTVFGNAFSIIKRLQCELRMAESRWLKSDKDLVAVRKELATEKHFNGSMGEPGGLT